MLSMSLGAGETTLLRIASGYCTIANGGHQVRATLIDRIQDRWGRTVWRHDQRVCETCKADSWANQEEPEVPDDRVQIMDPHTAYQMTSILEGVIQRAPRRRSERSSVRWQERPEPPTRRRTLGSSDIRPTSWSACSWAMTRRCRWARATPAASWRRPCSAAS
ncbi:MAG: hypothetical protein WDN31_10015 [Hyphomicrobium sp.]